ncbi:hypothetical protein LJC63_11320 [Ruminococcaceae bacterium OttesenSCG-928-L11]|nr:hypothetical protein [Ruminococcaceae bacterium OttesenSCG-928-L11]
MLQTVIAVVFIVEYGNASRTTVDPSPKLLVPLFNLQHCGGVGALRVNEDLLIKPAFVIAAG